MTERGPAAKGARTRQQLLDHALVLIARNGFRNTLIRDIADAAGISQAGALYHFPTREDLFAAILRRREEQTTDHGLLDPVDALVAFVRRNASIPGMIRLTVQMAADGSDADHPAHDFQRARYSFMAARLSAHVREQQSVGAVRADLDPEMTARMLLAITDGLQMQWLLDPTFDLADAIADHWDRLVVRG
jgi:AcrR family transcriptional regulator